MLSSSLLAIGALAMPKALPLALSGNLGTQVNTMT